MVKIAATDPSQHSIESKIDRGQESSSLSILRNKWVRLVIYVVACLFTSALYYGWQQYQKMLLLGGAYRWLCDEPSRQCAAQETAVARLYSIAAGCEYASAAVGGILLDHLGPKSSAIIGEIMWGIGTFLLALSNSSFQAYIPAMIIIGSSVNIICFAALATIDSFPKWQALMVSMTLASQTAATGVAPVLYAMMKSMKLTLKTIWLCYLAFVWFPVSTLYILALPGYRELSGILKLQLDDMLAKEATVNNKCNMDDEAQQPTAVVSGSQAPSQLVDGRASFREFMNDCKRIDTVGMGLYIMLIMLSYAYYPTVVAYAISEDISNYAAYIMPAQAVGALCVGLICEYFSTVTVMLGMCGCLLFVYICCLVQSPTWLDYIACTVLVASQCASFEVKFTYSQEMWDPYNFGKFVGLFGILSGCGTWLNIALSNTSDYKVGFTICIVLVPIAAVIALFLGYRQRSGVCYKRLPGSTYKTSN